MINSALAPVTAQEKLNWKTTETTSFHLQAQPFIEDTVQIYELLRKKLDCAAYAEGFNNIL